MISSFHEILEAVLEFLDHPTKFGISMKLGV